MRHRRKIAMPPQQSESASDVPESSHAFTMHARKCRICNHPQRKAIEHDFLRWARSHEIVHRYSLDDPAQPTGRGRLSLYRHARAAGLFRRRGRNLRSALGHIIERAEEAEISATAIVQAVKLYSQIKQDGSPRARPRTRTELTYNIENAGTY
jgi:hypothetical protein